MIFYFSGCGNSRFIAENIARAINEPLVFIPDAERREEAVLFREVVISAYRADLHGFFSS